MAFGTWTLHFEPSPVLGRERRGLDAGTDILYHRDGRSVADRQMSSALNAGERDRLQHTVLCMGCHREMADDELGPRVSTPGHLTDYAHLQLMNMLLTGAVRMHDGASAAPGSSTVEVRKESLE